MVFKVNIDIKALPRADNSRNFDFEYANMRSTFAKYDREIYSLSRDRKHIKEH